MGFYKYLKLFCRDRHADADEGQASELAYYGADGHSYSAKIQERYQKGGIYFPLFSKIKNLYWNGFYWNYNTNGNTSLTFTYYAFQKRCGYSAFNSVGFTVTDGADGNSKDGVVTHRLYEGTTALKYYSLTTYFRYDDNANSGDGEKFYSARNIFNY